MKYDFVELSKSQVEKWCSAELLSVQEEIRFHRFEFNQNPSRKNDNQNCRLSDGKFIWWNLMTRWDQGSRAFNQHENDKKSGEVFIFKSTIHSVFFCSAPIEAAYTLNLRVLLYLCCALCCGWMHFYSCRTDIPHKQCTWSVNRLCA